MVLGTSSVTQKRYFWLFDLWSYLYFPKCSRQVIWGGALRTSSSQAGITTPRAETYSLPPSSGTLPLGT